MGKPMPEVPNFELRVETTRQLHQEPPVLPRLNMRVISVAAKLPNYSVNFLDIDAVGKYAENFIPSGYLKSL
jgi:hypothetical protein